MTVVWIYAVDPAKPKQAEAFALSIALAKRHIVGATRFVVIGDKPPKDSEWISVAKRGNRQHDMIQKLLVACETDSISNPFLRLYDDHFILKPTTVEELSIPRYRGIGKIETTSQPIRKPTKTRIPFLLRGRGHRQLKSETFRALKTIVEQPLDYSYHPIVAFEKEKLRRTIEQFDGLIESLYLNRWAENPIPNSSSFFRNISCVNDWWFPHALPNVVCVYNRCLGQVYDAHLLPFAKSIGVQ